MFIVNIIILLLFLTGLFLGLKKTPDFIKTIDKREHKLYILYPLAYGLLTKTGLEKLLNQRINITKSIKALYNTSKPESAQKLFWCRRISLVTVIIVGFTFLSLIGQFANDNSAILNGKYLLRPDYGEGSKKVELNVTMEGGSDSQHSENTNRLETKEISISVDERVYTEAEINKIFEKAITYLKDKVLGSNQSAELIYNKLNFCNTIPGTSITVEWEPDDYNIIQSDGSIINEGINDKGLSTYVTAILFYREYRKEYSMEFKIMPKQFSEEEVINKRLVEEIIKSSEETAEDLMLELPDTIDGYRLSWNDRKGNDGYTFLLIGLIMVIAVWIFGDKELDNQMKKRKEQMLLDYPELINKFTLLVNAGMTIKQAWNKIVEDYITKCGKTKRNKRYAYEEMLTTANELKLGTPENIAYEQYGRRVGLIPYIKFSSLISQNLKKGTKGFTDLLMREAIDAFEDRKEVAKRLGEEAGTKLLIPMILMLILVFLIIMIPAFLSFKM